MKKTFLILGLIAVILCAAVFAAELAQVFDIKYYTIKYPADWIYETPSNYQVIFSGKQGTEAYSSTVAIQNIAGKKAGGIIEKYEQVVANFKKEILTSSKNPKIYAEKIFICKNRNGVKLTGKEFMAEYNRQGENFKQWQIVVPSADKKVFFAWAYTSNTDDYDTYLETAQAMLKSWEIK